MAARTCLQCGHHESDHRSGGLCETCIPPGDSTGRWSACQEFVAPSTPKPSDAEAERAACAAVVRAEIGRWSALSRQGVDELLGIIARTIEARETR